jgi:hypothetical protein
VLSHSGFECYDNDTNYSIGCVNNNSDLQCTAKFTINQRNSTTIYSHDNGTILEVTNLTSPSPAQYTAAEFFQVFDYAFYADQSAPSFNLSINNTIADILSTYPGSNDPMTVQECWQTTSIYGTFYTPFFQIIQLSLVFFNAANSFVFTGSVEPPDSMLFPPTAFADSYSRVSPKVYCCEPKI